MHALHVQAFVGVCHQVPEARGLGQPLRQVAFEKTRIGEPTEGVAVAFRRTQIEVTFDPLAEARRQSLPGGRQAGGFPLGRYAEPE